MKPAAAKLPTKDERRIAQRTSPSWRDYFDKHSVGWFLMSAFWGKADISWSLANVCF